MTQSVLALQSIQTVLRTPVLTYEPGMAGRISNFSAGTGETVDDGKMPGGCLDSQFG